MRGLGLGNGGNNIELNLIVDGNRDRQELKQWFTDLWNNEALVKDVKNDVLQYLRKLYCNHSPQFIYYLTLFHLFRDFLDGTRDLDDALRRVALRTPVSGGRSSRSRRTEPKPPSTRSPLPQRLRPGRQRGSRKNIYRARGDQILRT